jgi:2-hydroxymuconate-semialdehyde hydrolase
MKKSFYRRKRFWILLILLLPPLVFLGYLASNPLPNFRRSVHFLFRTFGIEEQNLFSGSRRIHYYEAGKEHSQTVILLHGFGGNALFTWMRLLHPLSKRYHVIAPDMLASNFLKLNPKTYSVIAEKDMVLSLVDSLGIQKADFVGLSVGGWVSLMIALERPELVDRLILIESAGITTEIPEIARLTLTDRETAARFMKLLFYSPPPLPGFVLDSLVASSKRIKKNYEKIFAAFIENSRPSLLDERLVEVHQPTLIIHGREDQVIPFSGGERLHLLIPHSRFLVLEKSGHAPVWDQPAALKRAILDFLSEPMAPETAPSGETQK